MPTAAAGLLVASAVAIGFVILDWARKVPIINPVTVALWLPLAINAPLAWFLIADELGPAWLWLLFVAGAVSLYLWLRLNIFPIRDGLPVGFRLRALSGAGPILLSLCWAVTAQAVVIPLSIWGGLAFPAELIWANALYSLGCCLVLYLNGVIRAVTCSRSMGVLQRWLLISASWVPLIGWPICLGASGTVRGEYLAGRDRVEWERTTPQDDRCATRYPLVLAHGVGWRDHPMLNAWGRIPNYLKRHGARVFYGGQDAWGSYQQNGNTLVERVDQVLRETGASRVNILAHSRGGIDARYAISRLGLADRVASLTTMATPHHGVRFADTGTKMNQSLYERLAASINYVFRLTGDARPDFMASTMAFRTEAASRFNQETPDDPRVYYQSYSAVMSGPGSDRLLSLPYRIIKHLGEDNDGLVSVDSAKWGNFRGVFRSTTGHGVSHADLVDMNRADYTGFNVLDAYITLVADLKQRGF